MVRMVTGSFFVVVAAFQVQSDRGIAGEFMLLLQWQWMVSSVMLVIVLF